MTIERKIFSIAGDSLDVGFIERKGRLKQAPCILLRFIALVVLGAGLLMTPSSDAAKGKYGKLNIEGAIKTELNGILQSASSLHLACVAQSDKRINENIRLVLASIKKASKKTSLAKDQKPHLTRMLDKARQHLEASLSRSGDARRESLKEAFNDLVQIARLYKLDQYQIFFCPSDKVVWLQKGFQPRNPVNPKKYGSCGKLVR